ncbi:RmlC-like cupin domain-containing protein [Aspergillus fruticulosus]
MAASPTACPQADWTVTRRATGDEHPEDHPWRDRTEHGVRPGLRWSVDLNDRRQGSRKIATAGARSLPALSKYGYAGAQQHLTKGVIRELHWHRVAEWGFVYEGSLLLSALNTSDIWYFPKGLAHNVQGLDDENECLLVFDDGDFEKVGITLMVDDWIKHTPRDVLAKDFGVNASVFDTVPEKFPYILNGAIPEEANSDPQGKLTGNSSYPVPGQGGTFRRIDSRNFPISTTIAATIVELEPRGLRELHWHPNFHKGTGHATVLIGDSKARTFDFAVGDTAVFPDNSDETFVWLEFYKSDRVADISLAQWLTHTPAETVANTLKIDIGTVKAY